MDRPFLPASEHRKEVGRRLRDALAAIPIEHVDAAKIMGVSKQSVSDWIAGRGYPNQYGAYRLHRMTGITCDWLFLGDWGGLPARLAGKLMPRIPDTLEAEQAAANQADETGAAA